MGEYKTADKRNQDRNSDSSHSLSSSGNEDSPKAAKTQETPRGGAHTNFKNFYERKSFKVKKAEVGNNIL